MSNHWWRRPGPRPVGPLSFYAPVELGRDEQGDRVELTLVYRNLLCAGEPGAGKSVALNDLVAHAALSRDCQLWLLDGKQVELGLWREVAQVFVGASITDAIEALRELTREMDRRYAALAAARRRKVEPTDPLPLVLLAVDELAYYSATVGTKQERETFSVLLRDLVARGRAAGVIVVAATQRPSADIIPTSLRDLFGYRLAFRCTTDTSSDIVLGHGWAAQGYNAAHIAPEARGIGWLLAEGGRPRRIKCAYLTDAQIRALVDHALLLRFGGAA